MGILALDLSLTGTGVCHPDGITETLHTKLRGMERLEHILLQLFEAMAPAWPDIVVLEGYSYGSKGRAIVNIGELGGVVRLDLHRRRIPYVEIPPSCLKKYATGRGNASKDDVLQQAVVRSGHTFADNNAADAWVLHQMALAHYEPESPLLIKMPAGNREGLIKVQWVAIPGGDDG